MISIWNTRAWCSAIELGARNVDWYVTTLLPLTLTLSLTLTLILTLTLTLTRQLLRRQHF